MRHESETKASRLRNVFVQWAIFCKGWSAPITETTFIKSASPEFLGMLVVLFLTTILHFDYPSTLIDHVSSRLQSIIDRALLTSQISTPKALTCIGDFYSRIP